MPDNSVRRFHCSYTCSLSMYLGFEYLPLANGKANNGECANNATERGRKKSGLCEVAVTYSNTIFIGCS